MQRQLFEVSLPNPKRDAEAVTAALRNVGFQSVTMIADAGRETLVKALGAFAREADGAGWALVILPAMELRWEARITLFPSMRA